jgi:hypothetical protein
MCQAIVFPSTCPDSVFSLIQDDSNSDGEGGGGAKLTTRVTVPAKSTQNWSKFLCNVEESKTGWLLKITGKDGVVHPDRLKELCEAMSNNTSSRKLDLDNAAFADDGCAMQFLNPIP